jgi:hypothetical protein
MGLVILVFRVMAGKGLVIMAANFDIVCRTYVGYGAGPAKSLHTISLNFFTVESTAQCSTSSPSISASPVCSVWIISLSWNINYVPRLVRERVVTYHFEVIMINRRWPEELQAIGNCAFKCCRTTREKSDRVVQLCPMQGIGDEVWKTLADATIFGWGHSGNQMGLMQPNRLTIFWFEKLFFTPLWVWDLWWPWRKSWWAGNCTSTLQHDQAQGKDILTSILTVSYDCLDRIIYRSTHIYWVSNGNFIVAM